MENTEMFFFTPVSSVARFDLARLAWAALASSHCDCARSSVSRFNALALAVL
jgi:hypothetical protein